VPGAEQEVQAQRAPGVAAADAPTRQVRRPSAVVRGLLLDSARRLFAAKGYAGASTREIATDAGVNEALIFRHFGNKVGLFRAAVVDPFRELIDNFVDSWEATYVANSMSTEDLTAAWIHALHDLMREHRDLVVALIAANSIDAEEDPEGPPLSDAFARPLERLERFTRREMAGRGLTANPTVAVRATFGMVLSMAVFDDWFFSGVTRPPSAETIAREMTDMIVFGFAGRAAGNHQG
jgi:AcrR family transcriptional regulator